jgi:hypothetical protein
MLLNKSLERTNDQSVPLLRPATKQILQYFGFGYCALIYFWYNLATLPQLKKNEYGDAVFVFSSIEVISCKLCRSDSIFPREAACLGRKRRQLEKTALGPGHTRYSV